MEDEKGEFTFRKWNYRRPNVEYGENNDDEIEASCPISCFCCFLMINCLFIRKYTAGRVIWDVEYTSYTMIILGHNTKLQLLQAAAVYVFRQRWMIDQVFTKFLIGILNIVIAFLQGFIFFQYAKQIIYNKLYFQTYPFLTFLLIYMVTSFLVSCCFYSLILCILYITRFKLGSFGLVFSSWSCNYTGLNQTMFC